MQRGLDESYSALGLGVDTVVAAPSGQNLQMSARTRVRKPLGRQFPFAFLGRHSPVVLVDDYLQFV
jgi:hypothetical protein